MQGKEFVARLIEEMELLFARLGETETLESESEGQVDVVTLLRLALKSEIEASELAGFWLPTTPEVDAKMTLALQCGDEMKHYGLHRHFTGSGSVVMFGGGMKKGYLHGETAPERPLITVKDPVSISDLHATIFTAMGISPKTAFDVEKRPFYATDNGKGLPVKDLFA